MVGIMRLVFDYNNIKGRKGNYCFCKGCEWNHQCPEKQKMFIDCTDMIEISEKKVEKIMELL